MMKTLSHSIWGKGDKLTIKILNRLQLKGVWLDLAAGDGRYVPELLDKVDNLIAGDADKTALNRLSNRLSKEQKPKIKIRVFDITKKFPFDDATFDGIFCTGALHLFSRKILHFIFLEIDRVLRSGGRIIVDFATDEKRYLSDGKVLDNVPKYKLKDAKQVLKNLLKDYKIKMYISKFTDDLTKVPEYGWMATGNFILLIGNKSVK